MLDVSVQSYTIQMGLFSIEASLLELAKSPVMPINTFREIVLVMSTDFNMYNR